MAPGRITNKRTGRTTHHCPKAGQNCDIEAKTGHCKKHQYSCRGCGWSVMNGAECPSCSQKKIVSLKLHVNNNVCLPHAEHRSCLQLARKRRRISRKRKPRSPTWIAFWAKAVSEDPIALAVRRGWRRLKRPALLGSPGY